VLLNVILASVVYTCHRSFLCLHQFRLATSI